LEIVNAENPTVPGNIFEDLNITGESLVQQLRQVLVLPDILIRFPMSFNGEYKLVLLQSSTMNRGRVGDRGNGIGGTVLLASGFCKFHSTLILL
jgi:hypothetical protein